MTLDVSVVLDDGLVDVRRNLVTLDVRVFVEWCLYNETVVEDD